MLTYIYFLLTDLHFRCISAPGYGVGSDFLLSPQMHLLCLSSPFQMPGWMYYLYLVWTILCSRQQEQESRWKFLMPPNMMYVTSPHILLASHVVKIQVNGTEKYTPPTRKGRNNFEQQCNLTECLRHFRLKCPTRSSWSFPPNLFLLHSSLFQLLATPIVCTKILIVMLGSSFSYCLSSVLENPVNSTIKICLDSNHFTWLSAWYRHHLLLSWLQ